jgi:uncharacterized protein (TIGR02266 family)
MKPERMPVATSASRRREPKAAARGGRTIPVVEVDLEDDPDTRFFTGFSGTISSGGLFIATYDLHPVGTTVAVRARLPGGHVVRERGTVTWIREPSRRAPEIAPGMGVAFGRLEPASAREIARFIAGREVLFFETA